MVEFAGDRAPFICQGQSLNLFLPADADKWDLLMLHWTAWEKGVKSLYYCRSKSIQRDEYAGGELERSKKKPPSPNAPIMRSASHVNDIAFGRLIRARSSTRAGIGLLETSGSYHIERYPWAYSAWKRQQQIHWMGEEVPLGEDIKDWGGKRLSESERNLLTQIFRFFTQSDIEVSDNYFKRYIPIFQPLEIQMMMAAFTNMETVHIDAYALLLKTLGMPQTEFEAFHDYSEMRAKADYMHTFGVGTVARCGAHARHVRRVYRRHVAVRELRHAPQFSTPQ